MDATRHEGLDALRALAAFFVIGIHTSGQYLAPEHWQSSNGYVAALVQGFVQIGVPLFFMLSGAFLLAQPIEKPSTFYRKRLPRLLIPLAVWLPLYYLYFFVKGADVAEYALHLFWAKGYFHLWFLPPLLGLYLVTPLLRKLIERVSRSRHLTLIAVGLLLLEVIGSLFLFVYQVELPIPILFFSYPLPWILFIGLCVEEIYVGEKVSLGRALWHEYTGHDIASHAIPWFLLGGVCDEQPLASCSRGYY